MASSEPAFLPVGTEVSAKYRGAFCEARVKKLVKSVKCKVLLKETQSAVLVTDQTIASGALKLGATVAVKIPETGKVMEGIMKHMHDCSMYTVVFDDGDERNIKRTQLCLKGEKHFIESETLDNLPLSNPEHFGTPVVKKGKRGRPDISGTEEESEESSSDESAPKRATYKGRNQDLVGKVMFTEMGDKRKVQQVPALVVLPDAHETELKTKDHLLVRSFKNGAFLSLPRKDLKEFTREIALKNEDKTMKAAMEKALLFAEMKELPASWNREELLGSEEEEESDEEDSSDEEQSEEKDRFVAQLYKFMDDRGTPINKAPTIGNKDLHLYRLFKIVQNYGGYNRVTNQMRWRLVYSKMGLPPSSTPSAQIKNAYKKYLHAFEDFYRKLGSSMGTISRPGRSRHNSGRGIMPFREREKDSHKEEGKLQGGGSDIEGGRTPDLCSPFSDGARSEMESDMEVETTKSDKGTPTKRERTPRARLDFTKEMKDDVEKKEEVKEKKEEVKKEVKKEEDTNKKMTKKEEKKEEKVEAVKKGLKKGKEVEVVVKEVKKEVEEEKDFQKKVGRRRSARNEDIKKENGEEDEVEVKKEEPEVKKERTPREKREKVVDKEEKKEKVTKEEKKDEQKEKKEEKKEEKDKKEVKKKGKKAVAKSPENDDENEEDMPPPVTVRGEFPLGTKLRVRYGRGRLQKEYEAKVVELGSDNGQTQYLVHYAGWNNRYDEWVLPERIVKVLEKPDFSKIKQKSPKPTQLVKKKGPTCAEKVHVAVSTSQSKVNIEPTAGPGRPKSKSPALTTVQSTTTPATTTTAASQAGKARPTRSNSVDFKVVEELPPKRRKRKMSGTFESAPGSESDGSGEGEDNEKKKSDEKDTSMEEGPKDLNTDILGEVDFANIDRSPPTLRKETGFLEEKLDCDEEEKEGVDKDADTSVPKMDLLESGCEEKEEKGETKEEFEEVVEEKVEEVVVEKVKTEHAEKQMEGEEKSERKVKKGEFKFTFEEVEQVEDVKKEKENEIGKDDVEKPTSVEESKTQKVEEESPYDFKDEPDFKPDTEFKSSRRKPVPVVLLEEIHDRLKDTTMDVSKKEGGFVAFEWSNKHNNEKKSEEPKEKEKVVVHVERRGRPKKNKDVPPKPSTKVVPVTEKEKKSVQPGPVLPVFQKRVASSQISNEKKGAFLTPAEKKLVYQPPLVTEESGSSVSDASLSQSDDIEISVAKSSSEEISEVGKEKNDDVSVEKSLENDLSLNENGENEKKKVRKKTKRKLSAVESVVEEVVKGVRREAKNMKTRPERMVTKQSYQGRKARGDKDANNKNKDSVSEKSAMDADIDLRCEEKIRSRSASPETVRKNTAAAGPNLMDSQEFKPLLQAAAYMESKLKHNTETHSDCRGGGTRSDSFSNELYQNTPPTTPEQDEEEISPQHREHGNEQIKSGAAVKVEEEGNKTDSSQATGGESPAGNASPSSNRSGGSSGIAASSEGSIDVPLSNLKRRRESEEPSPPKRRKRATRGKTASERVRSMSSRLESDSEEASNLSGKFSPHHTCLDYTCRIPMPSSASRSPRPSKYNFNLEEGKYLEGEERINFLVEKIHDIRKIYMNLKAEVACIDRRRKRLRRKEKDKNSSSAANSSSVEVEIS